MKIKVLTLSRDHLTVLVIAVNNSVYAVHNCPQFSMEHKLWGLFSKYSVATYTLFSSQDNTVRYPSLTGKASSV